MIDLILSATIPPLLIAYFVYRNDLYEKEPHGLVIKTFFLGCVLVVPMIVIEKVTEILFTNLFVFSCLTQWHAACMPKHGMGGLKKVMSLAPMECV